MASDRVDGAMNGARPVALYRVLGDETVSWRQWRAWGRAEPVLAGFDTARLIAELAEGDQSRADALLLALVGLAQRGPGAEAALVVLARCLLPGLRHRVSRLAPAMDRAEGFSVIVAALVERVHSYPLAERRRFVATFLLEAPSRQLRGARDIERAWAGHSRTIPDTPETVTDGGADAAGLSAETMLGLAVTAGVVTAADGWLIDATRTRGLDLRTAATCLGITYAAAIKRRQRAERRWAAWWDPDHPGGCEGGRGRP